MSQISEYFRSIFFPNLGITLRNIGDHINIGSFEVRFYGIIIMIGFLLAYVLVTNEAKRTKQNPEMYLDFILILIIPAILGARLYYILFRLDQYIVQGDVGATLKAMLNIRGGGTCHIWWNHSGSHHGGNILQGEKSQLCTHGGYSHFWNTDRTDTWKIWKLLQQRSIWRIYEQ